LNDEVEKNNIFFPKGPRKKIRNQNNEDQVKKLNIINLDWMMKFKTNNFFTRGPKIKIRNQKNKNQIEKYNICKLGWNNEIKNK